MPVCSVNVKLTCLFQKLFVLECSHICLSLAIPEIALYEPYEAIFSYIDIYS